MIATRPATNAATTLWRVRLPWSHSLERVLDALEDEPDLCCLTGAWAGGGAIVASEPLCVASPEEDPFALMDALPDVDSRSSSTCEGAVGGGWFGWFGYRLSERVEQVPLVELRPTSLPEFHLAYYDNVLRRDRYGCWWFEALETEERAGELEERVEHLRRRLIESAPGGAADHRGQHNAPTPLRIADAAAAHHLRAVAECRERIAAGEIFQANICLRLDGEYDGDAVALLRGALERDRVGGRLPQYTAAFDTPEGGILSLSPELFLRRRGRQVRSGPIKGTAARPEDSQTAHRALLDLRRSDKDAAEHVMIVDLMRNDIGRVCDYGSVRAPRHPTAEPHPGVWHLVTNVEGRLRADVTDSDLLRATFPPGSVTGAPKVQALRVIAELESTGREVYTGAVGFCSPLAGLELSVAIRTLELSEGRLWLGVGGGIVADSDPAAELEEALVKARPVAAAIGTTVEIEASVTSA